MIKIDRENTEIEGKPGTVMAEISSMWWNGIDYIAREMDVNPDDLREEIHRSGTYLNLRQAGMSDEEAKEVIDAETT